MENPGTEIGSPGNLQGINTGVVLLHLAKMRESNRFNKYLEVQEIDRLCHMFRFKGFIGDQVSQQCIAVYNKHESSRSCRASFKNLVQQIGTYS